MFIKRHHLHIVNATPVQAHKRSRDKEARLARALRVEQDQVWPRLRALRGVMSLRELSVFLGALKVPTSIGYLSERLPPQRNEDSEAVVHQLPEP